MTEEKMWGYRLNVKKAEIRGKYNSKVEVCQYCYAHKFPIALVDDGKGIIRCIHLFTKEVLKKEV